jgi:hydrogenase-1 operon protein HyaF
VAVLRAGAGRAAPARAIGGKQVHRPGGLQDADRALLNQVLGEGEVAAQVVGGHGLQAQESVFAGVWRVLRLEGGHTVRDTLEVGAMPQALIDARCWTRRRTPLRRPRPTDVMNAPALLAELGPRRAAGAATPGASRT